MKGYGEKEFRRLALDVLKGHPIAEYIVEQVWSGEKPNTRDCVRIGKLARTEQDVLRILRVVKR